MFQLATEGASGQKASATILYRNPNLIPYSQNYTSVCKDICSLVTTELNKDTKNLNSNLINSIREMRNNNKILVENVQVDKLIDTFTPLFSLRLSVAMLYFGCTTRTNGNDHDLSNIATDMQPFDCSFMPPNGDGPGLCHSNIE